MLVNFRTDHEEVIWIALDKIISLKEYSRRPGFLELHVLGHATLIIHGDLQTIVKNINANYSYPDPS